MLGSQARPVQPGLGLKGWTEAANYRYLNWPFQARPHASDPLKDSMKIQDKKPIICLLHPGKTGGTYLKSVMRHNKGAWTRRIKLLNHRETAATTAQEFGPDRKLAFSFRHPTDRFISAFQSRRRQGRPTYNRMWSPAEATAFLYFDTPNELAEALDSENDRMRSAAYFAFNSIMHIRSNYAFYFENLYTLANEAENIEACIDVSNLTGKLPEFLTRLGVADFEIPIGTEKHANPDPAQPLSERALANLAEFWAEEYEFYNAFKEIETSLSA